MQTVIKLILQIILKNNGGDDWDDAPYEHNAEPPYHDWSELIEDNEDFRKRKYKHHPIDLIECFFEFDLAEQACDAWYRENNSWNNPNCPYSVEDINKGKYPGIVLPLEDNFKIYAGTTFKEFKDIIKKYNGSLYQKLI